MKKHGAKKRPRGVVEKDKCVNKSTVLSLFFFWFRFFAFLEFSLPFVFIFAVFFLLIYTSKKKPTKKERKRNGREIKRFFFPLTRREKEQSQYFLAIKNDGMIYTLV
jgi:hypothetical protein